MLRHKYISKIKKLGLFRDVESFAQIEEQIAGHSEDRNDRGDALEVFAEAFLTLGFNAPYKSVHPENVLTTEHFKRLRIKVSSDNVRGIDGVLETHTGELHTYQVKFGSKGETVPWNKLTGSDSASELADGLLVFTNLSQIDEDIAKKDYVYSVKKDFLSTLTPYDFKRIEELIYSEQIPKKKEKIQLDPYQEEAVHSVLDKLKTDPRTQLIMPCGSGKTIVSQRIVEQMEGAKVILILVPTLQLLNDTLLNYFKNTAWESFPYICVGSKVIDGSAYDQVDLDPEELPFLSCTKPETIKKFLGKDLERKVIFSTYHSMPVVAQALGKRQVDVAIFDEAHNTASKKGNYWTFGLEDKNIRINKRVFLTATPRKFQLRRKNEEDMRQVFSMDDPCVYGKVAYELSFRTAAYDYEVICKYKIIISVISSEYYTREDLKSADVLVGYSDVNAETIAKQIALVDAVEKNQIKKIISFHPRISHASDFVGTKDKSIRQRLNGFQLYTISSTQSGTERRINMNSFRTAEDALISNAQCLNEGVDVPAVDMVAFMHPKKNKISIVQAVGRAIRKPRGSNKQWGYVFVPLFLEKKKGETDLEAAQRSNFNDLYEVINALRDHDGVLDDIIKKLRIQKGQKGSFEGTSLDDRIQINGIDLSIEEIRSFVQSEIVDRMTPTWFESYGRLISYYDSHKTIDIPSEEIKKDLTLSHLSSWIITQRTWNNQGKLDKEKFDLLDKLTFWTWDKRELNFQENLADLAVFKKANKRDPVISNEDEKVLASFVRSVRTYKKNGKLSKEREKQLFQKIPDWSFDPRSDQLEVLKARITEFIKEHGNSRVPNGYKKSSSDDYNLHAKLSTLRTNNNIEKLENPGKRSIQIYEDFSKIKGFSWKNNAEQDWDNFIYYLKLFEEEFQHTRVKDKLIYQGYGLGTAISNWRRRKNQLDDEQIKQLESTKHWSWDPKKDNWKLLYSIVYEYCEKNGLNSFRGGFRIEWSETTFEEPPYKLSDNLSKHSGVPIGTFIHGNRERLRKKIFESNEPIDEWTLERKTMLEKLPPSWSWYPSFDGFIEMLNELEKFFKVDGNVKVPSKYQTDEGYPLGQAIRTRRNLKAFKLFREDHIKQIKSHSAWQYFLKN